MPKGATAINRGVAQEGIKGQTGGVAEEGSSGVQVRASPVGIDAVEAGCMQEGTSSPSDGSVPES
jgi:hypothetical protein